MHRESKQLQLLKSKELLAGGYNIHYYVFISVLREGSLNLPMFLVTTIGSFTRRGWKGGLQPTASLLNTTLICSLDLKVVSRKIYLVNCVLRHYQQKRIF